MYYFKAVFLSIL